MVCDRYSYDNCKKCPHEQQCIEGDAKVRESMLLSLEREEDTL